MNRRILSLSKNISSSNKQSLSLLYRTTRHTFNDLSLEQLQKLRYNNDKNSHNNNNNNKFNIVFPIVGATIGTMVIGGVLFKSYYQEMLEQEYNLEDEHTIMNYSATHCATPLHYFTPNSPSEVENLVSYCHEHNISFRPMGSGISPNGLSFSNNAIMDMSSCNKILSIDKDKKQITVEAGIKVKDIIRAIIPYNMALENIPSIQEQQIGGLIQVGAHGTGINIPPCDMQVVDMTIITPKYGKIKLSNKDNPKLFNFAKVGLGTMGVITEITLQCVERHKLSESMWIMDVDQLIKQRNELLNSYKHCKWLWIPYTNNKVVVIASNPINCDSHFEALYHSMHHHELECQKELRQLLSSKSNENIKDNLSFADLRDLLLGCNDAKDILDTNWIKQINSAELSYWTNIANKYKQIDYCENILSFKCGGQQWVYEICFPIMKYHDDNNNNNNNNIPIEIQFTQDLLKEISDNNIAAPSPLEQRFTSGSTSYLSPAYNNDNTDDAFCWFGIIFYLPTSDQQKRRWISNEFHTYSRILDSVADKYGAVGHWAKVETHYLRRNERDELQKRLKYRFGNKLNEFFKIRNKYDPKGILINDVVSDFFDI